MASHYSIFQREIKPRSRPRIGTPGPVQDEELTWTLAQTLVNLAISKDALEPFETKTVESLELEAGLVGKILGTGGTCWHGNGVENIVNGSKGS